MYYCDDSAITISNGDFRADSYYSHFANCCYSDLLNAEGCYFHTESCCEQQLIVI